MDINKYSDIKQEKKEVKTDVWKRQQTRQLRYDIVRGLNHSYHWHVQHDCSPRMAVDNEDAARSRKRHQLRDRAHH